MQDKIKKTIKMLIDNGQNKLAKQIENLVFSNIDNKDKVLLDLIEDLENLDLDQINLLYKNINLKTNDDSVIEPIKYIDKNKIEKQELEKLEQIARSNLQNYSIVTLAGGQGTRLEHNGPKGTFELDVFGKKIPLFEIFANQLKDANKKYDVNIPWYIMTSHDNYKQTKDFFDKNKNFGLNIRLFNQNDMPLLDLDGNLVLDDNFKIKMASDGNGSVFGSLKSSGILDDMKKNNIKYIYISGVDNCLSKLVDVDFIGLFIDKNYEIGSKSIIKNNPHEKVGVFCKKNNKPKIIEYSELSKEMAELRNDDGTLVYSQSNIVSHIFTLEALEKICANQLKYHSAIKKNKFLDENLNLIIPNDVNSYKFESFIFDAFSNFDDMLLFMVNRDEEFAPIKNKEGIDSPETAKVLYENYLNNKR